MLGFSAGSRWTVCVGEATHAFLRSGLADLSCGAACAARGSCLASRGCRVADFSCGAILVAHTSDALACGDLTSGFGRICTVGIHRTPVGAGPVDAGLIACTVKAADAAHAFVVFGVAQSFSLIDAVFVVCAIFFAYTHVAFAGVAGLTSCFSQTLHAQFGCHLAVFELGIHAVGIQSAVCAFLTGSPNADLTCLAVGLS